MKLNYLVCTLSLFSVLACSPAAKVPGDVLDQSGIINTMRNGSTVTLLYQKSSTTDAMLRAEANRACKKIGKTAQNPQTKNVGSARNIPGVDAKIIYMCV